MPSNVSAIADSPSDAHRDRSLHSSPSRLSDIVSSGKRKLTKFYSTKKKTQPHLAMSEQEAEKLQNQLTTQSRH